jgi:predicted metal-binding protein
MTTTVTVCVTCRASPGEPSHAGGRSDGALLAEALEREAGRRHSSARIERHECLWACAHACAILIRGTERTGYLAGRFRPTADAAAAILDWTEAYQDSGTGTVPYAFWPEGMKGHFIARMPLLRPDGPPDDVAGSGRTMPETGGRREEET